MAEESVAVLDVIRRGAGNVKSLATESKQCLCDNDADGAMDPERDAAALKPTNDHFGAFLRQRKSCLKTALDNSVAYRVKQRTWVE